MQISLYPHQQKVLDDNPPRHLLAHSTGTGKTITAIALAEKNCKSCLIIVPKDAKERWDKEVFKHGNICQYTVITKETFKKKVKDLPSYDGVIVDEGHYFASMTSQLSKALYWYMKKHSVTYRWFATATPYLSTPMNIYTIARHLGFEWNYMRFQEEFFSKVKMGGRIIPVIKKNIEPKLALYIGQIASTVDMKEVVDVPEQSFETIYLARSKEQDLAIAKLEEPVFITRWTKTHQIENGFKYSKYDPTEKYECGKTELILSYAKKNKKLAVFCRYNYQIEGLQKELEAQGHAVFILNGNTKDRHSTVEAIESADECVALIQSSCSAGYELPSIATIVFASLSFSYVDYKQAIGRFLRINKLKENKYIHLVTKGVDEDVYNCIMKKEDFTISIYENKQPTKMSD